jgi:hypothetical protein
MIGLTTNNCSNGSNYDKPLPQSFVLEDDFDTILVSTVIALSKYDLSDYRPTVRQSGVRSDCNGEPDRLA